MSIQDHSPFQLPLDFSFRFSEYKDVSIGPGLHPVHSPYHLPSAGANAVISIINSLMQSEIWFRIAFPGGFLYGNYFE